MRYTLMTIVKKIAGGFFSYILIPIAGAAFIIFIPGVAGWAVKSMGVHHNSWIVLGLLILIPYIVAAWSLKRGYCAYRPINSRIMDWLVILAVVSFAAYLLTPIVRNVQMQRAEMLKWSQASRAALDSVENKYTKEIKELDPHADLNGLSANPFQRMQQLALKKGGMQVSQYKAYAEVAKQGLVNDLGDKITFAEPVKNFLANKESEKLRQLIGKSLAAYRAYRNGHDYRETSLLSTLEFALEIDEPQYYDEIKTLLESEDGQRKAISMMGIYHAKKGNCEKANAYINELTSLPQEALTIDTSGFSSGGIKLKRKRQLIAAIANSKFLCGSLTEALGVYMQYDPRPLGNEGYQAITIASFGSMLEMAGQSIAANKFFAYAKEKAKKIENNSHVLEAIALFQMQAGLVDEAFETVAGAPFEKWYSNPQRGYLGAAGGINIIASEIGKKKGIEAYKITNFQVPPSMEELASELKNAKEKDKKYDIGRAVDKIALRLFQEKGADAALDYLISVGKDAENAYEVWGVLKGHYKLSGDSTKLDQAFTLAQGTQNHEKMISFQMRKFLLENKQYDLVESLLDTETDGLDKIEEYIAAAQYRIGMDFTSRMNRSFIAFYEPYGEY